MMIDWSKTIEAYNDEGNTWPAEFLQETTAFGGPPVARVRIPSWGAFNEYFVAMDGGAGHKAWHIRNCQPELPTSWGEEHKLRPVEERFTPSSEHSPRIVTDTTPINRELWERCVGLVRELEAQWKEANKSPFDIHGDDVCAYTTVGTFREAREIAKLLPVVGDADLIEARSVAASIGKARGYTANWREECLNGEQDNNEYVIGAVAGIRRGRELERGSEK